jgi:hypothetical protein
MDEPPACAYLCLPLSRERRGIDTDYTLTVKSSQRQADLLQRRWIRRC